MTENGSIVNKYKMLIYGGFLLTQASPSLGQNIDLASAANSALKVEFGITDKAGRTSEYETALYDGEGIFEVSRGRGMPLILDIEKTPPNSSVSNRDMTININYQSSRDQIFINVRDVHFGKKVRVDFDASEIDLSRKSSLIEYQCKQLSSRSMLQSFITCRRLFFSYPTTYEIDKIAALKGWFDSSTWLASQASSIYRIDPELKKLMIDYEDTARTDSGFSSIFRRYFKEGYIQGKLNEVDQARLTDLRELQSLIRKGEFERAKSINSFAKEIFGPLVLPPSGAINGITSSLIQNNEIWIENLASSKIQNYGG